MEEVDFFALTLGSKQNNTNIVIKHVYRYHKVHNITALKQLRICKNDCMCSVIDTVHCFPLHKTTEGVLNENM